MKKPMRGISKKTIMQLLQTETEVNLDASSYPTSMF